MVTVLEGAGVRLPFELPPISHAEFEEFCRRNPDLQAELTAEGELVLMAPAEAWGDSRNVEITLEIGIWNRTRVEPGIVFGQSAGFTLPNGAVRSPDASWMPRSRWDALTDKQRESFAQVCPDFVVELMSPSDTLTKTREKMDEYLANGARLGWLIDRKRHHVEVYRPGQPVQILDNPATVSGEPELPGFVLDMSRVF